MSQVFGRDPAFDRAMPIIPYHLCDKTYSVQNGTEHAVYACRKQMGHTGSCGPNIIVPTDPKNQGHGHVFERPDGVRARCGGPGLCRECSNDQVTAKRLYGMEVVPLNVPRKEDHSTVGLTAPIKTVVTPIVMTLEELVHAGVTPMILKCPECKGRHIDEPRPEINWFNPPHRTHLCNHCGHLWRPQEYLTVGVSDNDWLKFMGSLTDEDWKESLKLAQTQIQQQAVTIAELEADKFQRIAGQMPLYARFFAEPTDTTDHIRLWYVDEEKKVAQGDSLPWDMLLRSIFTVMRMKENHIDFVLEAILSGSGLRSPLEYTTAIGDAGDAYLKSVSLDGKYSLSGTFRWYELWDAMLRAARNG